MSHRLLLDRWWMKSIFSNYVGCWVHSSWWKRSRFWIEKCIFLIKKTYITHRIRTKVYDIINTCSLYFNLKSQSPILCHYLFQQYFLWLKVFYPLWYFLFASWVGEDLFPSISLSLLSRISLSVLPHLILICGVSSQLLLFFFFGDYHYRPSTCFSILF